MSRAAAGRLAALRWGAPPGGSPTVALAWKESREAARALAVSLGVLAALVVAAHASFVTAAIGPAGARDLVLGIVAPVVAAGLGGGVVADERFSSTLPWLLARAVSPRRILLLKLAVHGLAALLWLAAALVAAALAVDRGDVFAWSRVLDASAQRAWALGPILTLSTFLWAFALSIVMPDELTTALAAALCSLAAALLVVRSPLLIAPDLDTVLAGLPALGVPLVAAPALLAWLLGRRFGPGKRMPFGGRDAALAAAVAVVAIVSTWMGLDESRGASLVARGEARAEGPVIAAEGDRAVAFVARPPSGSPRAVVAHVDAAGRVELQVLGPGTEPVGWTRDGASLLARWGEGASRVVRPAGRTRPPHDAPLAPAEAGRFAIEDGRLVMRGGSGTGLATSIYPQGGDATETQP